LPNEIEDLTLVVVFPGEGDVGTVEAFQYFESNQLPPGSIFELLRRLLLILWETPDDPTTPLVGRLDGRPGVADVFGVIWERKRPPSRL
jgi:hypothetical protein